METREPPTLRSREILTVFVFAFCCYACAADRPTPPSPGLESKIEQSPTPTPSPDQSTVDEFLSNQFDPLEEPERAAVLRAWRKIANHTNYYLIQHEYGEIAGAYGLALLVAEPTTASTKKPGLVAFIRRPGNRYDLYWIYRNQDFSQLEMSRASGNLFVRGTSGDGSQVNCTIGWSRKDNRWTCLSF